MKDIGEEVAVLDPDARAAARRCERIRADVPDELQALSVFTDVFDCFLRFLAALLDEAGACCRPRRSGDVVASCVRDYQDEHPELAERFARARPVRRRTSPLSCLNRLQLRNNRQMVDLADPASALALHGTLANPLAAPAQESIS